MKRDIPFDIPAGTSAELECILETLQAGPFASQIHLFVADPLTRELIMTVRGTAGSPPSS